MSLRYRLSILALALVFVASGATLAGAQCITGTMTAELQTDGPFAGLWCYVAQLEWDTPQGLSNLTIDCGFGLCPDHVCDQTFLFPGPAATSTGEPEPCVAEYSGEFNCSGNPSIGLTDPIIKWDALNDGCEPGPTGSGTFIFYSNLGPHPEAAMPIVLIKNGQNVCEGSITGDCPAPPCTLPTAPATWGQLKALHGE